VSHAIEVNSESEVDDVDITRDSQPLSFLDDIIVTPSVGTVSTTVDDSVLATVKRSLVGEFDGVSKLEGKRALRRVKVKIEKE
jgi:hypothetical protein